MSKLLAILLVLSALLFASAIASADEGYVLAGTCDDSGAWIKHNLKGTPAKVVTENLTTPVNAKTIQGLKLREAVATRPMQGGEIGRVRFGSDVQIVEFRVLAANPGSQHAVWAKVLVDDGRVIKGK